jgi:carotenoid cleavage dioxygenase-like enzyme
MTEAIAAPQSPYLEGNYAPVPTEIAAENLKVIGEIPPDLAGTFVRNGSNPRFSPKGRYHWFDGDGMVHGVHIAAGAASYRNRWVRTKAFLEEEREGGPLWTGVTERPDFSNPRVPFKDTANTDLVYHAGKLLALWWLGGEPYLTTGQATEEPLDDILTEFPRMDNRRLGRRSRYAYSPLVASAPTVLFEGFVKYDAERSGSATHRYAKGWFGGEVVFAPRAGSKEEDDGYLVTFVVEEATGTSELHVIDARDVTRGPVARVLIPQRVPTGYHAWWVPRDEG